MICHNFKTLTILKPILSLIIPDYPWSLQTFFISGNPLHDHRSVLVTETFSRVAEKQELLTWIKPLFFSKGTFYRTGLPQSSDAWLFSLEPAMWIVVFFKTYSSIFLTFISFFSLSTSSRAFSSPSTCSFRHLTWFSSCVIFSFFSSLLLTNQVKEVLIPKCLKPFSPSPVSFLLPRISLQKLFRSGDSPFFTLPEFIRKYKTIVQI